MISSTTRVIQVNLNRSAIATESVLQVAIELKVDIVVVQEPCLIPKSQDNYTTTRSVLHSAFHQILPADLSLRPRTLVYVAKNYTPIVNIASISPKDSDLLIIDIIEGNTRIQLLNRDAKTQHLYAVHPTNLQHSLRVCRAKIESFRVGFVAWGAFLGFDVALYDDRLLPDWTTTTIKHTKQRPFRLESKTIPFVYKGRTSLRQKLLHTLPV
jgi:hypothetical protein